MIGSAYRVKAMTCQISGCSRGTQAANQTTDASGLHFMSADHNAKQSPTVQMRSMVHCGPNRLTYRMYSHTDSTQSEGAECHLQPSYPTTTQTN